jgi:hypothetical protein
LTGCLSEPINVNVINIHEDQTMAVTAKLDEWGKPAWIAAIVLGFMVFWPIGLLTLAYVIGSGRMGCGHHRADFSRWNKGWNKGWQKGGWPQRSSGNTAFDEYRSETLKRLEDEEQEFRDFLDRLRAAKDKTEFDQFMAERKNKPPAEMPQAG